MASFFWLITLLSAVLGTVESIAWTELNVGELNAHDDSKRLVIIRLFVISGLSIKVNCPKPYVIYPRNESQAAKRDPDVFVSASGSFAVVPISKAISSLYGPPEVSFFQDERVNGMSIHYPGTGDTRNTSHANIIRTNAKHIHFLCAPPNFNVEGAISKMLIGLTIVRTNRFEPERKAMMKYLRKQNMAMAMLSVDISGMTKATHGCGSVDTPQFVNKTEVSPLTGIRSCTVDIMEHPDVGFYCDGIIKPSDCFRHIYDLDFVTEMTLTEHVDVILSRDHNWRFAHYHRKSNKYSFIGYCHCIDAETGRIKAKITIKTGTSHLCDITGMMLKHRTQPIIGNWCDVALLPGSTLTIKIPLKKYVNGAPIVKHGKLVTPDILALNSYIYPDDMESTFLNHAKIINELFPPKASNLKDYLFGDALQIDHSRKEKEGIITITYSENRPLSYPDCITGFAFIWALNASKGLSHIKDIMAVINLIPVVTHEYDTVGCEPPNSIVFPISSYHITSKQDMEINGHRTRVCQTYDVKDANVALYCPLGFKLQPEGCLWSAYDEISHSVRHWGTLVFASENWFVPTMVTMLKSYHGEVTQYSRSCSCVDSDGIEVSRMILSSYKDKYILNSAIGKEYGMTMIVPRVNIVDGGIEGKRIPEVEEIPFCIKPKQLGITLSRGTSIRIWGSGVHGYRREPLIMLGKQRTEPFMVTEYQRINEEALDLQKESQWEDYEPSNDESLLLPLNRDKYFYQHVSENGKHKLVPVEYSKVLGTSAGGFKVMRDVHKVYNDLCGEVLFKNPMSAIIVSKTNDKFIKLMYACGKLTMPHSLVDAGSNSDGDIGREEDGPADDTDVDVKHESQNVDLDAPGPSSSPTQSTSQRSSPDIFRIKETRALSVWGLIKIAVPATDPYLRGCGVTDPSEELFREDTIPMLNSAGKTIGCEVDIKYEDASFYCPLPYHTEPMNCMPTSLPRGCIPTNVSVPFRVRPPGGDRNLHFYIFQKIGIFKMGMPKLKASCRKTFECHCVTKRGIRMSTIRIHI
ncbi:hypothetical protein BgAZ_300850 [Babesia gibsoni]|uniref:6-Cys domain-containing protein n=1 Tax=Babesia gibsoni TaxID=33632 RepID=A0AAD8LJ75_BABGI|nr:hypothetical protein BgAZ_300850 [Babesia gibsoni]